jgi:hypothetical protein
MGSDVQAGKQGGETVRLSSKFEVRSLKFEGRRRHGGVSTTPPPAEWGTPLPRQGSIQAAPRDCQDGDQFIRFLDQWVEQRRWSQFSCQQEAKPVRRFAGFLQCDRDLIRGVLSALGSFVLLQVRAHRSSGSQDLSGKVRRHIGKLGKFCVSADECTRKPEAPGLE